MNKSSDDDILTLAFIGVGLFIALGASGAVAIFSESARAWLIKHQLLVTESVLLPIGDGAGLDLLRIVVIAATLLILVVLAVVLARSSSSKRESSRR